MLKGQEEETNAEAFMNGTMFRKLLAGIMAFTLTLTVSGCGGVTRTDAPTSDGSLQRVLDAGRLVLGLDANFPPMGFTDETGEIVGFDIDVAQEVCNRLGIELVKQPIDWDTKEDDLNSGRIDCIWNGMSISPARTEAMELSEPYMKNELIFVVPENNTAQTPHDLSGMTVGVQSGSTTQEVLESSDLYANIRVVLFDDCLTLFEQLEEGNVDAVFVDSVVAYYFIYSSEERLFVLDNSLSEEKCAIGFRKGNRELRDRVQELLSEMKTDGTLGDISAKWFGSDITLVRIP